MVEIKSCHYEGGLAGHSKGQEREEKPCKIIKEKQEKGGRKIGKKAWLWLGDSDFSGNLRFQG